MLADAAAHREAAARAVGRPRPTRAARSTACAPRWPPCRRERRSREAAERLRAVAAELDDLAADAARRWRGHRGRPGAAGLDRRAPPPAARAAPQVRRHAGRRDRLPATRPRPPGRAGGLRGSGRRAGGRAGGGRGRRGRRRGARSARPAPGRRAEAGRPPSPATCASWPWPRPVSRLPSVRCDPGDEVTFLLGANPGEPTLPLAKVASGGELARAMLALRLVLTEAPDTLVFDEVDAGVGGEAALAVGRALADARPPPPGPRRHPSPAGGGRCRRPGGREQAHGRRVAPRPAPWPCAGERARPRAVADAVGSERQRLGPRPRRGAARRGRPNGGGP